METLAKDNDLIENFHADTPLLLLINDKSGICHYSYRFRSDIDMNPQLLSGAITAITQLMEVAFNQVTNSLTQMTIDNIEVEILRFNQMFICCFYHSGGGVGPLFNLSSVLCATEVWQNIQLLGVINADDRIEINNILSELYTIDYSF